LHVFPGTPDAASTAMEKLEKRLQEQ